MGDRYNKTYSITWDQLYRDARALSWKLMGYEFKGIVALSRGGLVPAAIISRELDIRLIDTICISTYEMQDNTSTKVKIYKDFSGDSEGLLILDDLVDTGKTAKIVRKKIPKGHFATIYVKPSGKLMVDTFMTEFSQETWVIFPWERGKDD